MNKEVLDEFIIRKYDNIYAIFATDKAYELLGLDYPKEVLRNGSIKDTISDWHYRTAFLNFLANSYRIDGLVRVSSGNSHDASWETEVYIFNSGNIWQEELDKYRSKESTLYYKKPVIIDAPKINTEIIEYWANEYNESGNGEEERLVFCSYNKSTVKYLYSFERCVFAGTAGDKMFKNIKRNIYAGSRIYIKER